MGHKDQDQELRAVPSLRNLVQDVSLALVNTNSGHRTGQKWLSRPLDSGSLFERWGFEE